MNCIWNGSWSAGLALACLAIGAISPTSDDLADFEQRLETLRTEFRASERTMIKALNAAETPKEISAAQAIDPWKGMRERCDELAFDASGTEVAAGAWSMICINEFRYGTREPALEAFFILINDHADSEELNEVVARMQSFGRDNADVLGALHQLVEVSATASVRAGSLFSLAKLLEGNDATRDEAFGYYRQLVADYAEFDAGRGATFGEKATAALFEAEFLRVGQPVPDFTSIDETKTTFSLSDYKGKVVLVDFWGFW